MKVSSLLSLTLLLLQNPADTVDAFVVPFLPSQTTRHNPNACLGPTCSASNNNNNNNNNNDNAIDSSSPEAMMDHFIQARDWSGLEDYWQETTMSETKDCMTTALLNQRLRALGMQGKAAKAEALLRSCLDNENNHNISLVDQKSWVHVLRAHASLVGGKNNKNKHDNLDDDDDDDNSRLQRIQDLVKEMARSSHTHPAWTPSIQAYNAVLQAIAQHSHLPQRGQQAERILFGLLDKYNNNNNNQQHGDAPIVIPNADSFFWVYQASKGAHYPKVETLWHLQVSLWRRQAGQQQSSAALIIPSVRNLNAALAALARSHISNKAAKAQQLVQQLQDIRLEATAAVQQHDNANDDNNHSLLQLPAMEPNIGTYKNLMYAAAFTSHAHTTPRERKQALEMALDIHTKVLQKIPDLPARDETLLYRLALQAVGHLMDNNSMHRDDQAVQLFTAACDKGVVDNTVVTAFERAASDTVVLKILGGFAEDLIQLPAAWTAAATTTTTVEA